MGRNRKPVVCADGFRMSVQANDRGAYCTPRYKPGPYSAVEVGYPSCCDRDLIPYAEDPSKPTKTVYGWVPSSIIMKIIAKRGGMIDGELPPMGY